MKDESLLQRLEAERLGISYRSDVREAIKADKLKTYFDAGRYTAGARDATALKAWRMYKLLESKY